MTVNDTVDKYIPQLIPGFIYTFYFIGYEGDLAGFVLLVLFYSLIFSIVARLGLEITRALTARLILFTISRTERKERRFGKLYNSSEFKKATSDLMATCAKKKSEIEKYIKDTKEKNRDARKLLQSSEDNHLLIISFTLSVLADRYLLSSYRNLRYFIVNVILLTALWMIYRGEKMRAALGVLVKLRDLTKLIKKAEALSRQ